MKVIKWVSYNEAEKLENNGIGVLGGWFNFDKTGLRWKDFLDAYCETAYPYFEALREEVLEKELKRGGDWHQGSDEGSPVFSDNTVAIFSYRSWGDIMAAIWSEKENKDYNYMDFYVDACVEDRDNLDADTQELRGFE